MTEKEKYIAARTCAKIMYHRISRGYRDDMMIEWILNNEQYKKLNREMNELYQRKKSISDESELREIELRLANIYNQKIRIYSEMQDAETIIRIPDKITSDKTTESSRKRAIEQYIQLQLFILLTQSAFWDDPEIQAMLQWSAASQKITDTGKKLKKFYAIYYSKKKKGEATPVSNEMNLLRQEQESYKQEQKAAETILKEIAEKHNFPCPFQQVTQQVTQKHKRR